MRTRMRSLDLKISRPLSTWNSDPTPTDLFTGVAPLPIGKPDAPADVPPPPPPPTVVVDEDDDPGEDGSLVGGKNALPCDPLLDGRLCLLGVAMLTGVGIPAHADPDQAGLAAMGLGGVMPLFNCALNKSD